MASVHELLLAEFGSDYNLYDIFGICKNATEREINKAYHKLALRYHPDKQRKDNETQEKATRTFQALSAVHSILIDSQSRAYYDETGDLTSNDGQAADNDVSAAVWKSYFDKVFPKVTVNDIETFEKQYRYSEEEAQDVLNSYVKYKGQLSKIISSVMLSNDDDEARFIKIVEQAISDKKIKKFKEWSKSVAKCQKNQSHPNKKQKMREKKREKEEKEAEELMKRIHNKQKTHDASLAKQLRTTKREKEFSSLISNLEAKYAAKQPKAAKRKRTAELVEPSDEEFLAARQRLEKCKN